MLVHGSDPCVELEEYLGMSRSRTFVVFLVVIGIVTASGGAARAGGRGRRGQRDRTLRIGQLAPESGSLMDLLPSLTAPVTMAVDEINAAGGVLGRPVTYTLADDGGDAIATKYGLDSLLVHAKVDAIMGPASSESTLGILQDIRHARVLTCSGSNTAPELSAAGSGGYYFRTVPSDRFQGPALARLVLGEGRKRVGILARDDSYGRGLRSAVKKELTKRGAKVVADVAYDSHATELAGDVGEVVAEKPDAVIVLGLERDGSEIVRSLIATGLGPQQLPIYGADGMRTSGFANAVDFNNPAAVAGIKGTSPSVAPAGTHNAFPEAFAATGVDPSFSPYYYDCTILTALAAVTAKSNEAVKMKDAFASNIRGKQKCSTFAECKKLLEEGKTIAYQGASAGFARMNKFGRSEPNAGVYDVWAFDNAGHSNAEPPDNQIRIG